MFQSYQFRQINPDVDEYIIKHEKAKAGFNRINSGRSIPTKKAEIRKQKFEKGINRINSGRSIPTVSLLVGMAGIPSVSIVSIQADQSRPF